MQLTKGPPDNFFFLPSVTSSKYTIPLMAKKNN